MSHCRAADGLHRDPLQGRHDRRRRRARRRAGNARDGSAESGEQRADRQRHRLSGGSAFGLDAASGVMQWLDEQHIGYPVGAAGVVPIVPGRDPLRPRLRQESEDPAGSRLRLSCGSGRHRSARCGRQRRRGRGRDGRQIRRRRAGGGPMKAGIGSSAIRLPNGLVVAAIVAVNAVGDIMDPGTGQVVAGVRGPDGKLADARRLLREGAGRDGRAGENTTIGVVATNARLTKVQAQKMAQMAHDGYARAISPVHTPGDGDTIFSLATGTWDGRRITARSAHWPPKPWQTPSSAPPRRPPLEQSAGGTRSGHRSGALQAVSDGSPLRPSLVPPHRGVVPPRAFCDSTGLWAGPCDRIEPRVWARPTVSRQAMSAPDALSSGAARTARPACSSSTPRPRASRTTARPRPGSSRDIRLHVPHGPDRSAGRSADLLSRPVPGSVRSPDLERTGHRLVHNAGHDSTQRDRRMVGRHRRARLGHQLGLGRPEDVRHHAAGAA